MKAEQVERLGCMMLPSMAFNLTDIRGHPNVKNLEWKLVSTSYFARVGSGLTEIFI